MSEYADAWDDPTREFQRLRIENAGLRAEVERLRAEADHSMCRAIGEWYGVPAYAWGEQG
jgi:hypothetical protein